MKNLNAKKLHHQFSDTLDVKYKISVFILGAAKENCKTIRTGNVLYSNIANLLGHKE